MYGEKQTKKVVDHTRWSSDCTLGGLGFWFGRVSSLFNEICVIIVI